ncbi:LRR and NB-ARC domain disease resistance protein, partial [Trifolium pratense]
MWSLGEQLKKDSKNRDTSGGNLNGTEVESSTSGHENGIETNKFETDSGLKIPSVSISQGIKLSVEDTTTLLPTAKTITSSLEYGDFQIAVPFAISTTKEPLTIEEDIDIEGSHKTTQTNNQVSLNDDATMKVNSNIEEQFPKDEVLVSRSRLSCTTSQFLSMPSKGIVSAAKDVSLEAALLKYASRLHFIRSSSGLTWSCPAVIVQSFVGIGCFNRLVWLINSRFDLLLLVTEINVEEGTTSTDAKTISSSTTHLELVGSSSGPLVTPECKTFSQIKMKLTPETDQELVENVPNLKMQSVALLPTNSEENGDGKISIPSFSNVNTKPPATKYVDIGDSQETI